MMWNFFYYVLLDYLKNSNEVLATSFDFFTEDIQILFIGGSSSYQQDSCIPQRDAVDKCACIALL